MNRTQRPIISVRDLTKRFGRFTAVHKISFSVEPGEIFAFLGPNGAGKSTTIKMLTTLMVPDGGAILMDGHDPAEDPDEVRETFGIVFQDPSLDDDLTAYENMDLHGILYRVPRAVRRARIRELLDMVELWSRRNELVKHFSGGMKRRLEIARGLLHHPKILFLDEPTIGLDPQTRNNIWNHIEELNEKEGITVFFTTHYIEEAERVAERVAVIDAGRIVAQGTPAELRRRTGTRSLEDAFVKLTGTAIREEETSALDRMKLKRRLFRR